MAGEADVARRASARPAQPVLLARTVHGLEWACAAEVAAISGTDAITLDRREVGFSVRAPGASLLRLRTADDVFVRVGTLEGTGRTKADLAGLGSGVAALDWEPAISVVAGLRHLADRPRFDVVASLEGRRNYNRFDVERTIGTALAVALGWPFAERDEAGLAGPEPALTVRAFLRGATATIAVRLGSRPLHRRAYKQHTGPATLHPPVAAALAAIAAPQEGLLADPFCGDGTIAIEAALMRPRLRVLASDVDEQRVRNARLNSALAGVHIDVTEADAGALARLGGRADAIVTNPPWNVSVGMAGALGEATSRHHGGDFWDLLPAALAPAGVVCCIADADLDLPGLLAGRRWSLTLAQQTRLAGRMAHLVLGAPPGARPPALPAQLDRWRRKALDAGIITQTGF